MDIRNMSLMNLLTEIEKAKSQEIINLLVLELTYREYVPFQSKTFEELLVENGYKVIEKGKQK